MDQSTADAIKKIEDQMSVMDDRLDALEANVNKILAGLEDFVKSFTKAFQAAAAP